MRTGERTRERENESDSEQDFPLFVYQTTKCHSLSMSDGNRVSKTVFVVAFKNLNIVWQCQTIFGFRVCFWRKVFVAMRYLGAEAERINLSAKRRKDEQ